MGNIFSGCCSRSAGTSAPHRTRQDTTPAATPQYIAPHTRLNMTAVEYETALRAQATHPRGTCREVVPEDAELSEYTLRAAYWRAKSARAREIGTAGMLAEIERDAAPRAPFDYRQAFRDRNEKHSESELAAWDRIAVDRERLRQLRARGIFRRHQKYHEK